MVRRTFSPVVVASGHRIVPLWVLWTLLTVFFLSGCATRPYAGKELISAGFLARAQTQQQGTFRVTAAAPDAAETKALTGLDLYEQGIQPIWLEVENTGSSSARLALRSIDKDYFSPIEVAYMNRKKFSSQGYRDMERWFYDNRLQRRIPAGESRSGLVFTNYRKGTKGFNLDIFRNQQATSFTFFLPIPGFTADYTRVDFSSLYTAQEIRELDEQGLKTLLEQELPCCAKDETGQLDAGPLNSVLVGTPLAVRRSLLRGGWLETEVANSMTQLARGHRFLGRTPDAVFYVDRVDGNERLQLNLWMAPWRVHNEAVWLGQVFYRYKDKPLAMALREKSDVLRQSDLIASIIGESVSADIDSAQRFLVQNFWYNHSVLKVGLVGGVGVRSQENPGVTSDGFVYFTLGQRAVLFLSEEAVAMDQGRIIYTGHKQLLGVMSNE